MTDHSNALPGRGMQSGTSRATPDRNGASGEPLHPHVGELQAILDSPNSVTIGELAALIQSISRDLSFFSAALRDVIEPGVTLHDGNVSKGASQALGRKELEALGDLLSAQAHTSNTR